MGETKEIERSVQMRLYALHKRQFVAVFVLFLVSLLITILIGIAGPSVIQSIDYTSETPPKQLSGPYQLKSEYLDTFHQRLWLTMRSVTESDEEFRQTLNVSITVNERSSTPRIYTRQRTVHCQRKVAAANHAM